LNKFKNVKIEKIIVPVKCREGINKWQEKKYSKEVKHSCRVYPQITNTDGFFISKLRKTK
jgi:16S rRNA C967 or C1407 C5-methylase (RsmB/RsmF family)